MLLDGRETLPETEVIHHSIGPHEEERLRSVSITTNFEVYDFLAGQLLRGTRIKLEEIMQEGVVIAGDLRAFWITVQYLLGIRDRSVLGGKRPCSDDNGSLHNFLLSTC